LEFEISGNIFLQVTPFGVGKTIKSRKPTLQFIESYQILKRIGLMACKFAY